MLASDSLKIAWIYDLNAFREPTGVTRHARGQLEALIARADVETTAVSGTIRAEEGREYWKYLNTKAHQRVLPISLRDALRFWRVFRGPALETWTGAIDWAYAPAEFFVPARRAKRAVTSHDVLQDLQRGDARRKSFLAKLFDRADLIASVSNFNTERLVEAFPGCRDRIVLVPNAAEDLYFERSNDRDRSKVRNDLGLPEGMPYLLSVANFQARKNLVRLIEAAGRLREVASGELALVLIGSGSEAEKNALIAAAEHLGSKSFVLFPGYRQGESLRAIYDEARALVFPSLCESFGIPAVEALARGCPVALADSTALPEIAGDAGWYFNPLDLDSIVATLREILDRADERARRSSIGIDRANLFRWTRANDALIKSLMERGADSDRHVSRSSKSSATSI